MTDALVIRPARWSRPRPIVVWPCGPVDPETIRPRSRDLGAACEGFKLIAAEVVAETAMTAILVDPDLYGLHADRLLEATTKAREWLDAIDRLVSATTGDAA